MKHRAYRLGHQNCIRLYHNSCGRLCYNLGRIRIHTHQLCSHILQGYGSDAFQFHIHQYLHTVVHQWLTYIHFRRHTRNFQYYRRIYDGIHDLQLDIRLHFCNLNRYLLIHSQGCNRMQRTHLNCCKLARIHHSLGTLNRVIISSCCKFHYLDSTGKFL